jgi:hypothetical protein
MGRIPSSTLRGVGKLEWSFKTSGMVNASPEHVMAWWFDPERRVDFQKRVEASGASDVSRKESVAEGVRISVSRWKDRRGWDYDHHVETKLTGDGVAASDGDRFVAPVMEIRSYRSPSGRRGTVTCSGRIEFVPQAGGRTEVSVLNHHTQERVEGVWIARWVQRTQERVNTDHAFRKRVAQCQTAVGQSDI